MPSFDLMGPNGEVQVRISTIAVLIVASIAAGTVPRADAAPTPAATGALTDAVGRERARVGLPPLRSARDLVSVARAHASRMAGAGRIFHNDALARHVSGWTLVGENVGSGRTAEAIHAALMASPTHRANILDARFTQLGVAAAANGDGKLYVVQVFRRPRARAVHSSRRAAHRVRPSMGTREPGPAYAVALLVRLTEAG